VNAAAFNRHEADAPRRLGIANVIDREPCAPVARGTGLFRLRRAHHLPELTSVVGLLVRELGGGEHVLGIDDQE
jgi:hypothetical protein